MYGCGWMDKGYVGRWTGGCVSGLEDGRMGGRVHGWMGIFSGLMDGHVGWMDG